MLVQVTTIERNINFWKRLYIEFEGTLMIWPFSKSAQEVNIYTLKLQTNRH